MSDGATALRFDPLIGGADEDPYPRCQWLREGHQVHYDPGLDFNNLVQHRFSPGAARRAPEPIVRAEVDRLLGSFVRWSTVHLGREFSWRLPVAVSCRMVGFPPENEDFSVPVELN